MSYKIFLSPPDVSEDDFHAIKEAFESGWVAPAGPHLVQFENKICEITGAKNAVALSSGTAAIHLGLLLAGVGRGDEVLCSTLTFIASATPIVYLGARPVFIESERESWNLCPDTLEKAITDRVSNGCKPKALVVVHLLGQSANMKRIVEICQRHNIAIIEDAAESLGAKFEGQHTGTFGQCGVFSFNGNKILTTSGGGVLVSNDKDIIDRARYYATQAREPQPHYEHKNIGYNYRMSNLLAALGVSQLNQLGVKVSKRREVFNRYQKNLQDTDGISFMPEPEGSYANRWLSCIRVDSKVAGVTYEHIRQALEKEKIESRPIWKPLHLQPVFKGEIYFGDGFSQELFGTCLCLPSGSGLKLEEVDKVCEMIDSYIRSKRSKNL